MDPHIESLTDLALRQTKSEITKLIDHPALLEKLYRQNPSRFREAFQELYPESSDSVTVQIWQARLGPENEALPQHSFKEMSFLILLCLFAGLIAKMPDWFDWNPDVYYPRNLGFILFPFLSLYFAWRKKMQMKYIAWIGLAIAVCAFYLNALPQSNSDTIVLASIHMPVLLWALFGLCFAGTSIRDTKWKLDFLRFNGDLIVMSGLLFLAGALCTVLTFGMFEFIGLHIEELYMHSIGIWGLASIPIVASYLVDVYPSIVQKISPLIAKLFTPIVLLILLTFLIAMVTAGKDPYNDRNFLLICNVVLIAVMALVLFSLAENSKKININKPELLLLLSLSLVSMMINGIAFSAILYRIHSWGFSPNRICVLSSNFLIFMNLSLLSFQLFKSLRYGQAVEYIGIRMVQYLPVYVLWAATVCFLFPLLFGFQ